MTTKTKKFRVAVSGRTVDGRELTREAIHEMAATYNPKLYGARVNVEHYLSPLPDSSFSAMGDVEALSSEDITEGPLAGKAALYAEVTPTERMKQLTDEGKKIYSSIEYIPMFSDTGKPYFVGLAMTDTPASLGTERLKFTAQQRAQVQAFNNQAGPAPMFTEALEAELIQLSEQQADEGKRWFSSIMDLIGKGKRADSEQFSQVREAVQGVAESHAGLMDRFSALEQARQSDQQTIQALTTDLVALKTQLANTDTSFSQRPPAGGGNNGQQLADF